MSAMMNGNITQKMKIEVDGIAIFLQVCCVTLMYCKGTALHLTDHAKALHFRLYLHSKINC